MPPIDCKAPCHAPLREIIISRDGNILLCCRDWKRQNTFGNFYKQTLKEILNNGKLLKVYKELTSGNRFLDLCKRCGSSR